MSPAIELTKSAYMIFRKLSQTPERPTYVDPSFQTDRTRIQDRQP